jgi:hypothetical protein
MYRFIVVVCLILLFWLTTLCLADIPKLINYQGMLTDAGETPIDGARNMTFRIYDDTTGGGVLQWSETQSGVQVDNGLFNVILGKSTALDLAFDKSYWLEVEVEGDVMPRIRFTSVGYAYRSRSADRSDTADYALSSPSGPGDYTWTFRVTDGGDSTITTSGGWGIARYGNTLYGNADSTHVNLGVACTTGTSGEKYKYCTVGGGRGNTARGSSATVGGGNNNTADTTYATVAGGDHNTASGRNATVGGGRDNTASGDDATVGGGYNNVASTSLSVVGGGRDNTTGGACATVGGGSHNIIGAEYATIAGGYYNNARGKYATVGGGRNNDADTNYTTVAGGDYNTASGDHATVGGGYDNTADTSYATVGGGQGNTVGGYCATVGGGYNNNVSGNHAAVPGGYYNTASGDYSFAAGCRAKANHPGTFVWADGTNTNFASTDTNQFLIRASGGVGIGTTNPLRDLHIAGSDFAEIQLERTNTPNNKWHLSLWQNGLLFVETGEGYRLTLENGGNVGIGTTDPQEKLHVWWDTNVDAVLGRGVTDTDITYLALRNANGTKCYIYPNATGNGIVVSTTKP